MLITQKTDRQIRNKKITGLLICWIMLIIIFTQSSNTSYASDDGREYITITVNSDGADNNTLYSIDSTEPQSFSSSNMFTVPAGTSHTIYVKDAEGNITSQDYSINSLEESKEPKPQDINIDVEIGNKDYSDILDKTSKEAAEPGMGTAYETTKTDGSADGEKVFYTVTTAEGDIFYMIVDQTRDADNVYFLNAVTRDDLKSLAIDDAIQKEDDTDNLLTALKEEKNDELSSENAKERQDRSGLNPQLLVIILALIGGGIYYYLKVYKNKKEQQMDIMDAINMEDFETDQEQEEEVEFEMADDEKQAFLDNLIYGDEENELMDKTPDISEYLNDDDIDDDDIDDEMLSNDAICSSVYLDDSNNEMEEIPDYEEEDDE